LSRVGDNARKGVISYKKRRADAGKLKVATSDSEGKGKLEKNFMTLVQPEKTVGGNTAGGEGWGERDTAINGQKAR